ncbi:hypothetical protein ACFFX0_07995 [Citricoccus parietis]|uniref:Uncharacterized protein n=1 Tax=Citricoccus parietis TaxID=592307 RepID=A0ABV5FWS1_9MICC
MPGLGHGRRGPADVGPRMDGLHLRSGVAGKVGVEEIPRPHDLHADDAGFLAPPQGCGARALTRGSALLFGQGVGVALGDLHRAALADHAGDLLADLIQPTGTEVTVVRDDPFAVGGESGHVRDPGPVLAVIGEHRISGQREGVLLVLVLAVEVVAYRREQHGREGDAGRQRPEVALRRARCRNDGPHRRRQRSRVE